MHRPLFAYLREVDPQPLPNLALERADAGETHDRGASEEPGPHDEPPTAGSQAGSPVQCQLLAGSEATLGDALRLHPSLFRDDATVRLLLFALLQQLLGDGGGSGGDRPGPAAAALLESVAVTPQLWPQLVGHHLAGGAAGSSGVCPADLQMLTARWVARELSNFEYLLHLNRLAGRREGDPARSPIMPWVLDMTADPNDPQQPGAEAGPPPGWRDLSRSKWRLAKGDEQLDWTFSTSPVPHHLPGDALSELAYCMYKARRLPLAVLTAVVRGRFNAQEYPASLERLYRVTPEECIPELYSDPSIFASLHEGMPDLELPPWAGSAEEFVAKHRAALESDYVSAHLHEWVDITFGYKLVGQAAVEAKNVTLLPSAPDGRLSSAGYTQLFRSPHPKRKPSPEGEELTEPQAPASWAACLQQLEELEGGASCPPCEAGSSNGAACSGSHGLPSPTVQFGQLVVQLYLQRPVHICPLNTSGWRALLPQLPPAARRLAGSCLEGLPLLDELAALDFFTPAVRAAYAFLAPLYRPAGAAQDTGNASDGAESNGPVRAAAEGSSQALRDGVLAGQHVANHRPAALQDPQEQLLRLAQCAAEGRLLQLLVSPGALQLCLPHLLGVLRAALEQPLQQPQQPGAGNAQVSTPVGSSAGLPSSQAAEQGAGAAAAAEQRAVIVLLSLLEIAPRRLCCQHVLPAMAGWGSRLVLQSPPLACALVAGCGVAAFMETLQPVLLREVVMGGGGAGSGTGMERAAVEVLCSVARQVAPPITLEATIRPLLRALPTCPAAAMALVEVAAAMPPHLAASYVLLQLLQAFDPEREWPYGTPAPSATFNILAALEGLVQLLPAPLSMLHIATPVQHAPAGGGAAQDGGMAPSPLIAALLRPERQKLLGGHPGTGHAALMRIAGLVTKTCSTAGREALVQQLLPQLIPLFTCEDPHRLNYGMHLPSRPSLKASPLAASPPPDAAAMPSQSQPAGGGTPEAGSAAAAGAAGAAGPQAAEGGAAGEGLPGGRKRSSGAEEGGGANEDGDGEAGGATGSDSGYWDVMSVLYPPCLEAVGADALHSLVPNWAVIELNLSVRYEWSPSSAPRLSDASLRALLPGVRDLAARFCGNPRFCGGAAMPGLQEALRRAEATSRLIEGVAWLSPSSSGLEELSKAPSSGAVAAAQQPGGPLPLHSGSSGFLGAPGGRPLGWAWHVPPLDAEWLAGLAVGGGGGPDSLDQRAASNWQLQAQVLHEFRAHKERLRLCLANEDRQVVITAGKAHVGTRECEAIRTWALGDGEPGAQYVQHDLSPVISMCLVGGQGVGASPQVASCDASGALHVWSLKSGEQAYCLRDPLSHRASSTPLRCRGWLQAVPAAASAGTPPQSPRHGSASSLADSLSDPTGRGDSPIPSTHPESPAHGGPGAAGGHGGFTRVVNVSWGDAHRGSSWEGSIVAAGTTGGYLCLVDVERGELAGHFNCAAPSTQGIGSQAVSSLCCNEAWAAAGARAGWISVLDSRSGEVLWWWRGHEAATTALGAYHGHYLISGSKEGTVKLWDLRMGASSRGGAAGGQLPSTLSAQSGADSANFLPSLATGVSIPLCLGTFKVSGEAASTAGVGGLAMYGQQACICHSGASLGVISLAPGGGSSRSRVGLTRLLSTSGAPLGASIRGLTILPLSRLLVVGTEDGWLRVCR